MFKVQSEFHEHKAMTHDVLVLKIPTAQLNTFRTSCFILFIMWLCISRNRSRGFYFLSIFGFQSALPSPLPRTYCRLGAATIRVRLLLWGGYAIILGSMVFTTYISMHRGEMLDVSKLSDLFWVQSVHFWEWEFHLHCSRIMKFVCRGICVIEFIACIRQISSALETKSHINIV